MPATGRAGGWRAVRAAVCKALRNPHVIDFDTEALSHVAIQSALQRRALQQQLPRIGAKGRGKLGSCKL